MSRTTVLQSTVTDAQIPLLAGNPFNSEYDAITLVAAEAVPFGHFPCRMQANQNQCRLPLANLSTITFSADFVASNEIAIELTYAAYNSDSPTTVTDTTTYSTDQLTTMNLIRNKILALAGVSSTGSVSTSFGVDNRTLTVNADYDTEISIAITVTLGASQPTATQVQGTSDLPVGEALRPQSAVNGFLLNESTTYDEGENVAIMTRGYNTVNMEYVSSAYDQVTNTIVASQAPVYWRFKTDGTNTPGTIRTSNIAGYTKELSTKGIQWFSQYWTTGRMASPTPVGNVTINLP